VELKSISESADVQISCNSVKQTIVEGGILTIVIRIFLFPHSWRAVRYHRHHLADFVLSTFIAMYAFGFTINSVTLMALSLCIGLLIYDAIVVRENIVLQLAMGKDHKTAARDGTEEIGLAVLATTLAICAGFICGVHVGDHIGEHLSISLH